MFKYLCECGEISIIFQYILHLEGTLTFRDYSCVCKKCAKEISIRDLNIADIEEQEYLY